MPEYVYVHGITLDGKHVQGVLVSTVSLREGVSCFLVATDDKEWIVTSATIVDDYLLTWGQRGLLQRFANQD